MKRHLSTLRSIALHSILGALSLFALATHPQLVWKQVPIPGLRTLSTRPRARFGWI